jgi:arylsulfatase A-like enzyme
MQQNGYRTGYMGKWHTGSLKNLDIPQFDPDDDPDDARVNKKIQEYQDILVQTVKHTGGFDIAASIIWGNNERIPIKALQYHNLEWITKGALDFLDTCNSTQPFLLYVAPTTFHGPAHDESFLQDERYTHGGKLKKPLDVHPPRSIMRKRLSDYGLPFNHDTVGMTWMDDLVGAVLNKIKMMGAANSTIVMFQVDHNTEIGKGTCMQSGVRIPLLMKWPGVIKPGIHLSGVVQNIDVVPSLFECCNLFPPSSMTIDGKSFMPLLRGETPSIHDDLFFEFGYTRAVLWDDWKYIALRYPQNLVEQMKSGHLKEAPNHINERMQHQMNINIAHYPAYFDPDQLYNIKTDPGELINLAYDPQYRDILIQMKQRLKAYCTTFAHPFDLESGQTEFLHSSQFRALVQETKKIGTDYIPWWPKQETNF